MAQSLVDLAPAGLPALVRRSLARLEQYTRAAQAALEARQRVSGLGATDTPTIDLWADRAVSALRKQLESLTLLYPAEFPESARAAELNTLLFPDGLGFLTLPYVEQLTAMDVLMRRIDNEKLAKELDELCGDRFLRNLRSRLAQYRAMVKDTLEKPEGNYNLQEHRLQLTAAIVGYATKVVALHDEDDDQPSAQRIHNALRPIAALRAQLERRAATSEAAPTPDTDPKDPPATPPTTDPAPVK